MRLSPALILALTLSAYGDPLKSVSLSFARTVDKNGCREATAGHIYHEGSTTTVVVSSPLEQWMVIEKGRMTLYYPEQNRAIQIESDRRAALPFFDFFLAVALQDFGLPALGYSLARSEIREDVLYTYWDPPKRLSKVADTLMLALREDKIVYSESLDPKGVVLTSTTYTNHVRHAGVFFPLKMTALQMDGDSEKTQK